MKEIFLLIVIASSATFANAQSRRNSNLKIKNMTENKQTIQKYIDGFMASDHAKILSCLTDDVTWVIPGAVNLSGKQAFDKEIENENFVGSPTIEIIRMAEENNIVVAEGTVKCNMKNGGLLEALFCDVFQMQNGKIKHLTSYIMNK
jgi:uncharacterized protein